jgi:hypothetical protein
MSLLPHRSNFCRYTAQLNLSRTSRIWRGDEIDTFKQAKPLRDRVLVRVCLFDEIVRVTDELPAIVRSADDRA